MKLSKRERDIPAYGTTFIFRDAASKSIMTIKLGDYKTVLSPIVLLVGGVIVYRHWMGSLPLMRDLLMLILSIKLKYFLLALSTYISSVFLHAKRWRMVLQSLGYNLRTMSLFPIIFSSISINNLTPANRMGGEPFRLFWIKRKYGVQYADSFASILFERVVEAVPISILAAVAIYAMYDRLSLWGGSIQPLKIILLILITLSLLAAMLYLCRIKIREYITILRGYREKLRMKQLHSAVIPCTLLSSTLWILDIIRLKLITLSLGLKVPVMILISVSIIYLLTSAIPLTPGGLGIVEGSLTSALVFFGLPLAAASGVVVVERFVSYILSSIIGSFMLVSFGGVEIWESIRSHL